MNSYRTVWVYVNFQSYPLLLYGQYSLIMTPDTASSRAAMRAEVPTDRASARVERVG